MKKILLLTLAVFILAVAYWLLSPFFIDKQVSEDSPLLEQGTVEISDETDPERVLPQQVASGMFVGFDDIHHGSGTASLIKTDSGYVLRFEEDFVVANGPDLYVGLGTDGQYVKDSEISKLKGNIGSQNYELPPDFDITTTNEVWIWCRAFSTPFARAVLDQR